MPCESHARVETSYSDASGGEKTGINVARLTNSNSFTWDGLVSTNALLSGSMLETAPETQPAFTWPID